MTKILGASTSQILISTHSTIDLLETDKAATRTIRMTVAYNDGKACIYILQDFLIKLYNKSPSLKVLNYLRYLQSIYKYIYRKYFK